jgi:hypothetical protein
MSAADWQTDIHKGKTRKRSRQNPGRSLSSLASIDDWETELQEPLDSYTIIDDSSDDDYTLVDFAEEYEELDEEDARAHAEKHREAINISEEVQKSEGSGIFGDE